MENAFLEGMGESSDSKPMSNPLMEWNNLDLMSLPITTDSIDPDLVPDCNVIDLDALLNNTYYFNHVDLASVQTTNDLVQQPTKADWNDFVLMPLQTPIDVKNLDLFTTPTTTDAFMTPDVKHLDQDPMPTASDASLPVDNCPIQPAMADDPKVTDKRSVVFYRCLVDKCGTRNLRMEDLGVHMQHLHADTAHLVFMTDDNDQNGTQAVSEDSSPPDATYSHMRDNHAMTSNTPVSNATNSNMIGGSAMLSLLPNGNDLQCDVCLKICATKRAIQAHRSTHMMDRKFVCTLCVEPVRFAQSSQLKRHIAGHNGEKNYACTMCSHVTSQKSNLATHMKRQHNVYECAFCQTKVCSPQELILHFTANPSHRKN